MEFLALAWNESNSSTNPNLSVTIDSELSITAEFQPISYDLSITETDGGETSGAGSYIYGEDISILATPKQGYRFGKWTGDIEYLESSLSAETTATIPDKSISFSPVFEIIPIEVVVSVTGSGSVVGAGLYNPQEIISLQAVGNPSTGVAPRGLPYYNGLGLMRTVWSKQVPKTPLFFLQAKTSKFMLSFMQFLLKK